MNKLLELRYRSASRKKVQNSLFSDKFLVACSGSERLHRRFSAKNIQNKPQSHEEMRTLFFVGQNEVECVERYGKCKNSQLFSSTTSHRYERVEKFNPRKSLLWQLYDGRAERVRDKYNIKFWWMRDHRRLVAQRSDCYKMKEECS